MSTKSIAVSLGIARSRTNVKQDHDRGQVALHRRQHPIESRSSGRPSNTPVTPLSRVGSASSTALTTASSSSSAANSNVKAPSLVTSSIQPSVSGGSKRLERPLPIRKPCTKCHRLICLNADGLIRSHGPGCAGAGLAPADDSIPTTLFKWAPATIDDAVADTPDASNSVGDLDLIDAIKSVKCRVLKRIPKGSRMRAADKFASIVGRIVAEPDNLSAWRDLLLFGYSCLGVPGQRGGKRHHSSLASKINAAIDAYPSVVRKPAPATASRAARKQTGVNNIAARVSEKLEEGDVQGAIRLAASECTMAPHNNETVEALRLKHPPRATSLIGSSPPPSSDHESSSPLVLGQVDIVEAIKSFPSGSAGGLDGIRPQHLKDLAAAQTGEAGQRMLSQLTDFANLCLAGRVPAVVRPVFCGASLCALAKKDGSIRPIAVGCTLRRLVAKAAVKIVRETMASRLAPTQLGFGVRMGTEAAAHAARRFLSDLEPGKALLKLDFCNAFNALKRDYILQTVREELPELYPFVVTCYANGTLLSFGENLIKSEEGAQQGDPLGPLLFCAATFKLAKSMKSEMNLWYIDDGTLGGNVADLLADFQTVRRSGEELGLVLNVSKCELITDDSDVVAKFREVAPDIKHVSPSIATLLGAPIGTNQGTDLVLSQKLNELKRLTDRLKVLCAHDAFYLLKNCFALPKLQYVLRSAPCYSCPILAEYDDVIRRTLQSILNISMSDVAWDQATLPVSNGGLGIRSATDVALPAFLASVSGSHCLTLQILPCRLRDSAGIAEPTFLAVVEDWKARAGCSVTPQDATKQKAWDMPLVDVAAQRLLSTAPNQVGLARLIAVTAPQAGAFLHAIPCAPIGTRLDDTSLRIAIALRLGAPVCAPHTCVCGETVDTLGTHGLCCRKSAGRHSRHSALNDLIKRALASADIPSRLEPTSLSRVDGKRPDGLSTMPWKEGRCLLWDVTCPDTLAASHVDHAVTGPGVVATIAENRKRSKYAALCAAYYFVPVAIETLGALGEEAMVFLKDLGSRIANVSKEPRAPAFLMQRISVAIQRGNAACILGTAPNSSSLDDIFYL
jgi:hypothetical protein